MSVARAAVQDVLTSAFAETPTLLPPFNKYYNGAWNQAGINGLSSDVRANSSYGGAPAVVFDSFLQRYTVIADDTVNIRYAESPDGINWSADVLLASFPSALYAVPVGLGEDPQVPNWNQATVERLRISCAAASP